MMKFAKYILLLTIPVLLGLWLAQVAFSAPQHMDNSIAEHPILEIDYPILASHSEHYEIIDAENVHRLKKLVTLSADNMNSDTAYLHNFFFSPDSSRLARHPSNSLSPYLELPIWDISEPMSPTLIRYVEIPPGGSPIYFMTMVDEGTVTLELENPTGWRGGGTGTPSQLNLVYHRPGQSPYQMATIANIYSRNPVALSDDGMLVAYYDSSYLKIWSARTYAVIASIHEPQFEGVLRFSEDGRFLMTARESRQRIIWQFEGGNLREYATVQDGGYNHHLSPEGDYVLSMDTNRYIQLTETRTNTRTTINTPCEQNFKPAFSPDSQLLAIGANCSDDIKNPVVEIQIFSLQTGEILARHLLESADADTFYSSRFALSFSPDNTLLAVGLYQHNELWGIPKQFQDTSNAQG